MNGKPMWWDVMVNAIRDTEGVPELLLAVSRDVTERKRSDEMFQAIAEGTASVTGSDFFYSLVRHLASALQVRYAFVAECFVAECRGEQTKCARSRAFWKGESFGENFEYEVPRTPCMGVLNGKLCHHAARVQELFPDDKDLVALGAESYLGIPLVGSSGEVIGHMAILDNKPMHEASVEISVLKVFAGRAGAELERLKAQERERALLELNNSSLPASSCLSSCTQPAKLSSASSHSTGRPSRFTTAKRTTCAYMRWRGLSPRITLSSATCSTARVVAAISPSISVGPSCGATWKRNADTRLTTGFMRLASALTARFRWSQEETRSAS
jgi:hypothetical protein